VNGSTIDTPTRLQLADMGKIIARRGGGKGQRDGAEPELEQAAALGRDGVVMPLPGGGLQDGDLGVVQVEDLVDIARAQHVAGTGIAGFFIRQEDLGWTGFLQDVEESRTHRIGEALC
jgi:hypothetical protein